MPTATYLGPWYSVPNPDTSRPSWIRNTPQTVSTEWLDAWGHRLSPDHFKIEGYELPTVDEGNDGIPDSSWRKADIEAWLSSKGAPAKAGYKTKTTLLSLVDSVLNPVVEAVAEADAEPAEAEEDSTEEE